MKKINLTLNILCILSLLTFSCCTTKSKTENTHPQNGAVTNTKPVEEEPAEVPEPEIKTVPKTAVEPAKEKPVSEPEVIPEPEPEPEPVPEPEPEPEPVPEPEPEPIPPTPEKKPEPPAPPAKPAEEPAPADDEYSRSVADAGASISKETFEEDKKAILNTIAQLDEIMKNRDYKAWVKHLDNQSIQYWSKKSNLQKASARLPVKGLQLTDLQSYFNYVFIPSRKGRTVEEIRYETDTDVKAVQVDGNKDTVYYNFHKVNGIWKLHLPSISD